MSLNDRSGNSDGAPLHDSGMELNLAAEVEKTCVGNFRANSERLVGSPISFRSEYLLTADEGDGNKSEKSSRWVSSVLVPLSW